jgi:hypothetical protein
MLSLMIFARNLSRIRFLLSDGFVNLLAAIERSDAHYFGVAPSSGRSISVTLIQENLLDLVG